MSDNFISNKLLPIHILRLYVWEMLKRNSHIELLNGNVPIIPISDEADFADSNKPYIIYGFSEQPITEGRVSRGVAAFRIIGKTYAEINHIANVLQRAFEDTFITESVNNWSSQQTTVNMIGVRFTDFEVSYVEGGEAPDSEAGRRESVINITYGYVADYHVSRYVKENGEWIWR